MYCVEQGEEIDGEGMITLKQGKNVTKKQGVLNTPTEMTNVNGVLNSHLLFNLSVLNAHCKKAMRCWRVERIKLDILTRSPRPSPFLSQTGCCW